MNKVIGIIEEKGQNLADKFGFTKIEYLQEVTDDEIDQWVKQFFQDLTIEKIIIPVRLGSDDSDYTGLRVGLHIRLTKELGDKRFIPIIFVSEQTKNEIIGNQLENNKEKTASILFTKGIKLVSAFDIQDTAKIFSESITEQELRMHVLSKLLITNQREEGHQLANEWGVFRLAKFAGIKLKTAKLPPDLYFKFQFAKTDINIQPRDEKFIGLERKGCNAVLIDDYADKGWAEVIKHILQSHISQHKTKLDILKSFEDASNYQRFEEQDIIFLDLRLSPQEDKIFESMSNAELSGVKILKKIKTINQGIQVIIFTASNKAWNMKRLLDEGADAYFIKESPEYIIKDKVSEENYKNLKESIKGCFDNGYLKEIYKDIQELKQKLDKLPNLTDFTNEIKNQLDIAYSLLSVAKLKEQFAYAFVSLYLIIETVNNQFVFKNSDKTWNILDAGNLLDWKWDELSKSYINKKQKVQKEKPPEWKKFAGIYFQKWQKSDHDFIKTIYFLIRKRNGFVHNVESILNKQKNGLYLNRDIYEPDGFKKLFDCVKKIINYL